MDDDARTAMRVDAVACALLAVVAGVAAVAWSDELGVPAALLWVVGLVLVPWVGFLLLVATRLPRSRPLVAVVAAANLAWVVGSAAALAAGRPEPTAGRVAVAGLALVVLAIAGWQLGALRRRTVAV